jgi:putative GTP pyrophosphokinase
MTDSDSLDKTSLRRNYSANSGHFEEIKNRLIDDLSEFLNGTDFVDSVIGRVKGKTSFVNKVQGDPTKYDPPFRQVEDLIGLRVLVYFRDVAEDIYEKIRDGFLPNVENKHKEPANPNQFGYEGFHVIQSIPLEYTNIVTDLSVQPSVFEIQVKTLFMHAWAQPEHLLRYKSRSNQKEIPIEIQKKLAWIAASAWGADSVMLELKDWLFESQDNSRD